MRHIYLDYNASTPIDPAVAAAMKPFLEDDYGNPSSGHWSGAAAKAALETSRGQIAALLGCQSDEIVFTSGGSEANNLALKGAFFSLRDEGNHIVTTRIEHPAIIAPCRFLRVATLPAAPHSEAVITGTSWHSHFVPIGPPVGLPVHCGVGHRPVTAVCHFG